jgi:hypothetical protein
MTAGTGERLASDYLARLDAVARTLPADRRADLLERITEHLASARDAGELGDEAVARTLLDRLGEPEEIVAAARDEGPWSAAAAAPGTAAGSGGGPPPWGPPSWHGGSSWDAGAAPGPAPATVTTPPSTALETAAVLMLTLGSLLPVVGWLIGVALLWTSRRWRTREKVLGTLVVPFGPGILLLLSALTGFGTQTCSVTTSIGGGEAFSPQFGVPGPGAATPPQLVPPGQNVPGPDAAPPSGVFPVEPPGGPPPLPELPPPFPGGFETVETCTQPWLSGGLALGLAVLALVAPIAVAVLLLRRARARAAAEPPVVRPVGAGGSPWGGLEIAAVVLLAVGPFVAPVAGTAVGLVLMWCSPRWSTGEKAIASILALVPAALLAVAFGLSLVGLASGGVFAGVLGLVVLAFLGSVAAAVYLAVVLSRRP